MSKRTFLEIVEDEYPLPKPCEKRVGSKFNLAQLIQNSKAINDYQNLIFFKTPPYGKNTMKETQWECCSDFGKPRGKCTSGEPGRKFIYVKSKTTEGMAASLVFAVSDFFDKIVSQEYNVCCPESKINDGKCSIEFFTNPQIISGRRILIFIFMLLAFFICLRYIY